MFKEATPVAVWVVKEGGFRVPDNFRETLEI